MKNKKSINTQDNIIAIDLFCGAGGLTHGLVRSGIKVKLGVDIEPACQFPFETNNNSKFILKSVKDLQKEDLNFYFQKDKINLLAGCAPCQTFSNYNSKATDEDERWWLLLEFSRLVKETSPELVTMENVPGLRKQNVFHEFVSNLKELGYYVSYSVVNVALYGLPQRRKRLVLLASKLGEVALISPEEFSAKEVTVKEAIGHLPPLKAGEFDIKDPLHKSAILSKKNLQRIKLSKPEGTWRDWPEDLIASCHKKNTGATYRNVYGRMSWDKPSPTITTQFNGFGNGRFGHPEQDRAISLREGAILQGFPDYYQFVSPGETPKKTLLTKMIGNAVPVLLGEVIGKTLKKHIKYIKKSL